MLYGIWPACESLSLNEGDKRRRCRRRLRCLSATDIRLTPTEMTTKTVVFDRRLTHASRFRIHVGRLTTLTAT